MFKTFIDLFAGIGGFRLALESKGLKCIFSSEIDKHSRLSYKKNFGEEPAGDITKINVNDIPKHDILCAGFPCQSFSLAGNRKTFNDKRGLLFYEIIRIAKHHKPKLLLLENVKGILILNNKQTIKIIQTELMSIGYKVNLSLLNSSFYGIPQTRERVYFVCIRNDLKDKIKYTEPKKEYIKIYLEDILDKKRNEKLLINKKLTCISNTGKRYNYFKVLPIFNKYKLKPIFLNRTFNYSNQVNPVAGQDSRTYSIKGHSPAIISKAPLILINKKIYRLTINEIKRIMAFPESHIVSDKISIATKQLGNAVIPTMIKKIYENIKII